MNIIPVHQLTYDQALAELERLLDAKPSEDQVLEFSKWRLANAERCAELETWCMMHAPQDAIQSPAGLDGSGQEIALTHPLTPQIAPPPSLAA